jgi:DNA mismatch endonuclease, patch repair protein
MVDVFSPQKRSLVMSHIRSKDTIPELKVRATLHSLGFRFRLHDPKLPGKPDIVLRKHHAVVEVKGCFWHGHGCRVDHTPRSHKGYWLPKILANIQRDRKNERTLRGLGWAVFTVWECECRDQKIFCRKIRLINKSLRSERHVRRSL